MPSIKANHKVRGIGKKEQKFFYSNLAIEDQLLQQRHRFGLGQAHSLAPKLIKSVGNEQHTLTDSLHP